MSWSVSAKGKVEDVAKAIDVMFENTGKCLEPEETIKQDARALIAKTLKAQTDDDREISVSAWGSQTTLYKDGQLTDKVSNSLNIVIS